MSACARKDCAGKLPATLRPVILIRVHMGHPPLQASMGIVVCKDCAIAHHAVSDFVTAEAWNAICEGLRRAGKVEPTFDLTTIDFIDADDTRWDPAIAKREADPAHTITVAGGAKA